MTGSVPSGGNEQEVKSDEMQMRQTGSQPNRDTQQRRNDREIRLQ